MYSSIQRVHRKKQFFVLKFLWRGQVIICKNRKLIWCDLIPMNLITNPLSLNWSNFFAGAYLDDPAKRDTRFGLLKVFLTVITGLSIGAWVSQKMAAFLEENELFGEAHHIISRFLNLQIYEFFLRFFFNKCFVHPIFRFWFLVTFGDEVTKIGKYYVIFVYILQGKMGKTKKNRNENHATKVTKRRQYGMNETFF